MSEQLAADELLARVAEMLGDELSEVEQIFCQELESRRSNVCEVFEHATRFRGKRLRPMLLLLSASASGGIVREHKILAAVVEMIHTATLVHDDVLDEADIRRHVATVNARWNNETSVLFGDYLFTHAFHLASSLDSTLACRLIGRATNIVCEGELTQIHQRGNSELTEEDYLQIINDKTAELCAVSCFLGAHFARAQEPVVASLSEYGRSLGIAFQIADDLLDILGVEEETGKSLGSDLQKQKLTLPLIRLLNELPPDDAEEIRELLTQPDQFTREQLRPYFDRCDALDYSHNRARHYADQALCQLDGLDSSPAKQVLEDFTDFVTQRAF